MVVLSPGDAIEAKKMVKLMINDPRPNYIRLPRASLPTFSTPDDPLEIGRAYLVRQDDNGRTKITVTIEEHQINGGLGSSIASLILSSDVRPTKFKMIGVNDQFGQSGTMNELWHHYGLDVDSITQSIRHLLTSN